MRRAALVVTSPAATAFDDNGLGGEARARTQQPLQLPAFTQILDAAERGDDLLAHRRAFAPAFDDLEIGAAAGGLLAEIHGAEPWGRLMRGPHIIRYQHQASQTKPTTTWHYIFAKLAIRSNNINDLPPAPGSQVLKISQTANPGEPMRPHFVSRRGSRSVSIRLPRGLQWTQMHRPPQPSPHFFEGKNATEGWRLP